MSILDWLGRTLFLILSGCATYALIAAIASLSSTGSNFAADRAANGQVATLPVPSAPETPVLTDRPANGDLEAPATPGQRSQSVPGADPQTDRISRLLEILVHAVLALAGFVAAGVLVLLRISSQLHRRG